MKKNKDNKIENKIYGSQILFENLLARATLGRLVNHAYRAKVRFGHV